VGDFEMLLACRSQTGYKNTMNTLMARIRAFRRMINEISRQDGNDDNSDDETNGSRALTVRALRPSMLSSQAKIFSTRVRKSSSVLEQNGVRVKDVHSGIEVLIYFCLRDNCWNSGKAIRVKRSSTLAGTRHLIDAHGVQVTRRGMVSTSSTSSAISSTAPQPARLDFSNIRDNASPPRRIR
jgi:hypothetical protein